MDFMDVVDNAGFYFKSSGNNEFVIPPKAFCARCCQNFDGKDLIGYPTSAATTLKRNYKGCRIHRFCVQCTFETSTDTKPYQLNLRHIEEKTRAFPLHSDDRPEDKPWYRDEQYKPDPNVKNTCPACLIFKRCETVSEEMISRAQMFVDSQPGKSEDDPIEIDAAVAMQNLSI